MSKHTSLASDSLEKPLLSGGELDGHACEVAELREVDSPFVHHSVIREMPREERLLQAVVYLQDMLYGIQTTRPLPPRALRAYRFIQTAWSLSMFKFVILIVYLGIAIFECPSWINNWECIPPPHDYFLSGVTYLPYMLNFILEFLLLALILADLMLCCYFVGFRTYFKSGWSIFRVCVLLVCNAGVIITASHSLPPLFQINRIVRPLVYISVNRRLRDACRNIAKVAVSIVDFTVMFVLWLFFGAWVCLLLFYDTEEGKVFFPNYVTSFGSLATMMINLRFPDFFVIAEFASRWYMVFFIVPIIVGLFLVRPLFLAIIYQSYRQHIKNKFERTKRREFTAMCRAFQMLDADCLGILKSHDWSDVFHILHPDIERKAALVLFHQYDTARAGHINERQFTSLCGLLKYEIRQGRSLYNSGWRIAPWYLRLKAFVVSSLFEHVVNFFLVINIIILGFETFFLTLGRSYRTWFYIDFAIVTIFSSELCLRLICYGRHRFFRMYSMRFDCFCVFGSLGVCSWYVWLAASPTSVASQYFHIARPLLFVRLLRMYRLIYNVKRYQVILRTFAHLIPALSTIFMLMCCGLYVMATVGAEVFGGVIYPGNPKLANTTYFQSGYGPNFESNFNDFGAALSTVFQLIIVNNSWYSYADSVVVATRTANWAYFVVFYVVVALLAINLVTAFGLETFMFQWRRAQNTEPTSLAQDEKREETLSSPLRTDPSVEDGTESDAGSGVSVGEYPLYLTDHFSEGEVLLSMLDPEQQRDRMTTLRQLSSSRPLNRKPSMLGSSMLDTLSPSFGYATHNNMVEISMHRPTRHSLRKSTGLRHSMPSTRQSLPANLLAAEEGVPIPSADPEEARPSSFCTKDALTVEQRAFLEQMARNQAAFSSSFPPQQRSLSFSVAPRSTHQHDDSDSDSDSDTGDAAAIAGVPGNHLPSTGDRSSLASRRSSRRVSSRDRASTLTLNNFSPFASPVLTVKTGPSLEDEEGMQTPAGQVRRAPWAVMPPRTAPVRSSNQWPINEEHSVNRAL